MLTVTYTVRDAHLKAGKFSFQLPSRTLIFEDEYDHVGTWVTTPWAVIEAQTQAMALKIDPLIGGVIESISVSFPARLPAGLKSEVSVSARTRIRGNVKFQYGWAGPYTPSAPRTMAVPAWAKDEAVFGYGLGHKDLYPKWYADVDHNSPQVIAFENWLLHPEAENPNFGRVVDPRFGQPLDHLIKPWVVTLRDEGETRNSPYDVPFENPGWVVD